MFSRIGLILGWNSGIKAIQKILKDRERDLADNPCALNQLTDMIHSSCRAALAQTSLYFARVLQVFTGSSKRNKSFTCCSMHSRDLCNTPSILLHQGPIPAALRTAFPTALRPQPSLQIEKQPLLCIYYHFPFSIPALSLATALSSRTGSSSS